jgi:K+-sensing histidine kinase KdpD
MMSDPSFQFAGEIQVPFQRVAGFVRQVTHDVRNGFNAMDLQAAFLLELATDPESTEEIKRLRAQISQSANALKVLSANFALSPPNFIAYGAAIFIEDFRDRLLKLAPGKAAQVEWTVHLEQEEISIDIEMIFNALAEVFKNASQFAEPGSAIAARAFAENDRLILEISEGKAAVSGNPENWGREPFVSTRRGGYGLGLFRARMIISTHGGDIHFAHDAQRALLTTRITLPFAH